MTNETIKKVECSEIAHCLYQAMSRGSCRIIEESVTKPMKVWLIHKGKKVRQIIEEVMPGMKWLDWEPAITEPNGKIESIAAKFIEYLRTVQGDKVSTRMLKQALDLKKIPKSTFTAAV
ncbi:MAG: hypothetical protein MUC41_18680, partial [Syntrophobacteraceae bacterium]|nr:hypothetical protein [Syntrophobacteraceae bacterium]